MCILLLRLQIWKDVMKRPVGYLSLPLRLAGLVTAVVLSAAAAPALAQGGQQAMAMHRLYNPYSGEHLYTSSASELSSLDHAGWSYEGVGWYAPLASNVPVHRLYNPYSGDHHYTADAAERDQLVAIGWESEGVGWYSDDAQGVPLYRQHNPYVTIGTHNYTTSIDENDHLVSVGWHAEGKAWYGLAPASVGTVVNGTPFMGASEHSRGRVKAHLAAALEARGREFPSDVYARYGAGSVDEFVDRLFDAAETEGVRADVIYAQAMIETGFLGFGGAVQPEYCNFSGLGATDRGDEPNRFSSVYEGFLAQAQHLRAYAGYSPRSSTTVDQRWGAWLFGRATTIEGLSGTWATDAGYGAKILAVLNSI